MKGGLVKAAACKPRQKMSQNWKPGDMGRRMRLTLGGILECRMQVVDHLGEDVARPLIAILIYQKEPQAPFPHRKLLHGRRLVAAASG